MCPDSMPQAWMLHYVEMHWRKFSEAKEFSDARNCKEHTHFCEESFCQLCRSICA